MKKNYLAPTSETLSTLIFSDICDAPSDPETTSPGSGTTGSDMSRAPQVPHGL